MKNQRTLLPSPRTAEEMPGPDANVKLAGGRADAIPSDEEASASDVRSITASSMFAVDTLGAAGADCCHQGAELDISNRIRPRRESRCLYESSLSGTRVFTPGSLALLGGLSPLLG